jgi:phospholipid/cholesterol/gamma-HCH transport system permease protein
MPQNFGVRVMEWFGELGLFAGRVFHAIFTRPFEGSEFLRQLDSIGSKSLPLVALAGAATGVVLSMQTRESLIRFGAKSMLPAVIIYSIIRETGPIITALIVSGRVGAGIGAELGSMKVTEQIDAMEASAVNPYKFLAATRILACIVALPLLTVAADFSGIVMGWIATTLTEPVSLRFFFEQGTERRHLQRPSSTDVQDLCFRIHHWPGVLFSGHEHARRDRRRGAIRYQLGAAVVVVRDSGRRGAGPIHHRVFRASMTWKLKFNPIRRRSPSRDYANPSVSKRS